jgi:hypothetical protein
MCCRLQKGFSHGENGTYDGLHITKLGHAIRNAISLRRKQQLLTSSGTWKQNETRCRLFFSSKKTLVYIQMGKQDTSLVIHYQLKSPDTCITSTNSA